jgi:transcription elongation GreA/GreB family factor
MTLVERDDTIRVEVGARVRFQGQAGEDEEVVIVPHTEADPAAGLVSMDAPVGRSLLGHRAGDRVLVRTPSGVRHLTITAVGQPEGEAR